MKERDEREVQQPIRVEVQRKERRSEGKRDKNDIQRPIRVEVQRREGVLN